MSETYRYIGINNYSFCLQQSPAVLAWILFLRREDLRSICNPWGKQEVPSGIIASMIYGFEMLLTNLRIILLFTMYHYRLKNSQTVFDLSAFGHVCLHVHKGYKLFDLSRGIVTKIFESDVNPERISDEVERLRNVSSIDYAPRMYEWNIEDGWYEEEYVSEYPSSSYKSGDPESLIGKFHGEVLSCLIQLIKSKGHQSISLERYVKKITGELDEGSSHDAYTKGFVDSITDKLLDMGGLHINLVFSHGDFCPANIIETRNGMRILDWENAEFRSLFFDFYSYFFYFPGCMNYPSNKTAVKVHEDIVSVKSMLLLHEEGLYEESAELDETYRMLFYLELLCRLQDRLLTDSNMDMMDFIARYIRAFQEFEKLTRLSKGSISDDRYEVV